MNSDSAGAGGIGGLLARAGREAPPRWLALA